MESLLLDWFEEHGRDLPWRGARDPYAILVSEVMLQQTQVERVVPRYLAWLERWPSVESLAGLPLPMSFVSGRASATTGAPCTSSGRRSRSRRAGGPHDLTELPGVGPYTDAALRCFAFGEDVLPVDVNVERVLRRTSATFTAASTQALMDLGATICIARVPRCDACPLARACPSRGTRDEPARRQGPFEGSFRQRRATTLRLVAGAPQPLDELDGDAVRSLERDGLVVVGDERVALPG